MLIMLINKNFFILIYNFIKLIFIKKEIYYKNLFFMLLNLKIFVKNKNDYKIILNIFNKSSIIYKIQIFN